MSKSRVVRKELNEFLDKMVDGGLFAIVRESVIYRFLRDRGWLEKPEELNACIYAFI